MQVACLHAAGKFCPYDINYDAIFYCSVVLCFIKPFVFFASNKVLRSVRSNNMWMHPSKH